MLLKEDYSRLRRQPVQRPCGRRRVRQEKEEGSVPGGEGTKRGFLETLEEDSMF